jgi:hypothetical protein
MPGYKKQSFMWIRSFSKVYPGVRKEDVWQLWTDINNWPKWHGNLDDCKMEGAFKVGNHFLLKPKGMKAVKIMLREIEEGKKFTDCTTFFGARMYDTHAMEETPEGLQLTNLLVVTGPLKWLWIKLVAQNVAATAPDEMETLVNLARGRHV